MSPNAARAVAPESLLRGRDLAYRYPGAPGQVFAGQVFAGQTFADQVFAGVDLAISPGEFVALIGGSGVGKSTLLRVLAGLVEPERGRVALDAPRREGTRRRAVVFQDARLLPWFTLARNVGYGLEGLGLPREARERRIEDVLALTGLTDFADRYPHQLSGGQQQRGGIARALAVRPALLLMDEPFSAVDAITRVGLQDELMRLHVATRTAVLFVTHDIDEAVLLADRVLVMRHEGGPARVVADYAVAGARPRARGAPVLSDAAAALRRAL